jgi:hypothetical protein
MNEEHLAITLSPSHFVEGDFALVGPSFQCSCIVYVSVLLSTLRDDCLDAH